MSIEAKHAYRFEFLRSERWKNLRLERLVRDGARCRICKKRDLSNDVHHIKYRTRWEETVIQDLRTLCRDHHDQVHKLMNEHPDWDWQKLKDTLLGRPPGKYFAELHIDEAIKKRRRLTVMLAYCMHLISCRTLNRSGHQPVTTGAA